MVLLFAIASPAAHADCPAAPIGDPDDMAISFLKTNGVQAASASLLASSVKEGMLVYDDSANRLKICDGTNWVPVGTGSGADTLASLSCTSGQIAKYNGTAWACAAGDSSGGAPATVVAFSVHKGGTNQTVSSCTDTLLTWPSENFDTNNSFASNRFTSTVAGKYAVTLNVYCPDASTRCDASIRKNGAFIARQFSSGKTATVTTVVSLDGLSDYLDAATYDCAGTTISGDISQTNFSGALISGGAGDTLAGLSCAANQIPKWNGTAWACAADGGGGGSGVTPAFRVHRNSADQTVVSAAAAIIDWTIEDFDTANNFDPATDRFTPTIAGKYLVTAGTYCPNAINYCLLHIYKNGTVSIGEGYQSDNDSAPSVTALVDMNGTTDYLTVVAVNSGGTTLSGARHLTYFSGFLAGAAGSDTLSGLSCTSGQIPKWNGTAWVCAADGGGSSGITPVATSAAIGNQTTTSTAFVDMPGASVTFTSNGLPVLVMANFTSYSNTPSATGTFQLVIDGAVESTYTLQYPSSATVMPTQMQALKALSAGSHTAKIRWLTSTGTLTANWNSGSTSIIAHEIGGGGGSGGGGSNVGFLAEVSSFGVGTTDVPVTGYTELRDDGNGFNAATGVFTAPIAGYYDLSTYAYVAASGSSNFDYYITTTGAGGGGTGQICREFTGSATAGNYIRSCSASQYLAAGQTATVRIKNGMSSTGYVRFSGALVGGGSSQWADVTGGINYAGGKVGIGTAAPASLLHISGGADAQPKILLDSGTKDLAYPAGQFLTIGDWDGTTFTRRMDIDAAGNVGIGTNGAANTSSVLDVASTTKGFLPPRMTTAQRGAIASPASGLIIYDTDLNQLFLRTSSSWNSLGGSGSGRVASGSISFGNGNCTTAGSACSINIVSGGFTTPPSCVVTMSNVDGSGYSEHMVVQSVTTTTLKVWKGQYLSNGTTMSGHWVCVEGAGSLGGGSAGSTPAGTVAGAVQFRGSSAVFAADDANLIWDNTNKRLGIGTMSPDQSLHVFGGTTYRGLTSSLLLDNNIPGVVFEDSQTSEAAAITSDAGQLRFYTRNASGNFAAGDLRMTIQNTGNVGIGTTSPGYPLQIASGSAAFPTALGIMPATHATSRRAALTIDDWMLLQDASGDGTKDFGIWQSGVGLMRMFIGTNGNVGIGTMNPANRLEVSGSHVRAQVSATDDTYSGIGLTNPQGTYLWQVTPSTDAPAGRLRLWHETAPVGEYLTVLSNGNVGIGAANPGVRLQISGDVSSTDVTNGFAQLWLTGSTSANKHLALGYDTTGNYGFVQGNTYGSSWDNLVLEPKGGNVGIGTTSPAAKLDVSGTIQSRTSGNGFVQVTAGNAANNGYVGFFGAGGTRSGYVGWGAQGSVMLTADTGNAIVQAAAYALVLDNAGVLTAPGAAYKPGGGAWAATSDARLKDIDGAYEQGLASVVRLEPVRFHYKKDNPRKEPSDKPFVGLIAQDVQKTFPEAVSEGQDGYLSLDTTPINFAIINAIKELKADNDNLRAELKAANDNYGDLRREIDALRAAR